MPWSESPPSLSVCPSAPEADSGRLFQDTFVNLFSSRPTCLPAFVVAGEDPKHSVRSAGGRLQLNTLCMWLFMK